MIVFDLSCSDGHRFEGWFASSDDYERQNMRGLVSCPNCGSTSVGKAPMAPAVPKKGNQAVSQIRPQIDTSGESSNVMSGGGVPPQVAAALQKIAELQTEALRTSEWVGDRFAEESRAIHYGEREEKPIHGRATARQAQDLLDEGISVAPLLIPVSPPDELN